MSDRIPAHRVRDLLCGAPKAGRRSLRISWAQAKQIGFLPPKTDRLKHPRTGLDPQALLTQALRDRLGADAVLSEVKNLIPGRRYRADIVIPAARLVIEFDGFQYHRSKAAFQKDRERQNLFVAHGWRVLRFFNRQVASDLDGVVNQIVSLCKDLP